MSSKPSEVSDVIQSQPILKSINEDMKVEERKEAAIQKKALEEAGNKPIRHLECELLILSYA
jgi:hypothetical protein